MKRPITILLTLLLGILLDLIPMTRHLEAIRPHWTLMIVMFWALYLENLFSVGTAWLVGLFLDLTKSYIFGLHGFIFALATFLVKKYYLWLKGLTHLELTVLTIIIFLIQTVATTWINGFLGSTSPYPHLWFLPIISSTLLWPLISNLLNELCVMLNIDHK